MVQNLTWVKDPSTLKADQDFNIIECKMFTDMVSDATFQLTHKKLHYLSSYSIKDEYPRLSEKVTKHASFFQLHICVRLGFLHILPPKHIKTG